MYTGSYHRAARRAADAITTLDTRIMIFSARHGLLLWNLICQVGASASAVLDPRCVRFYGPMWTNGAQLLGRVGWASRSLRMVWCRAWAAVWGSRPPSCRSWR
jgi:hypothetical protein